MIKKTVCYDSSPALHIAEARVIELPSGTSLAQFLMVRKIFHHAGALSDSLEKRFAVGGLRRTEKRVGIHVVKCKIIGRCCSTYVPVGYYYYLALELRDL